METKLVGRNLHQHILTSLYMDRSLGDTVLRVEGRDYICHAAMLAATSSLFRRALQDPQIDKLSELIIIVMADWTGDEVELFLKQAYNQVDLTKPSDMVKVESILSFMEIKPEISKIEPIEDHNNADEESGWPIYEDFDAADFDPHYEDDGSDYEEIVKPKISKKRGRPAGSKNKKTVKNSESGSDFEDELKTKKDSPLGKVHGNSEKKSYGGQAASGECEYCNKYYKNLKSHIYDKHLELVRDKENIKSSYPQDCPFCGKVLLNRKFKGRHKCFKIYKTKIDYRRTKNDEAKIKLEREINEEKADDQDPKDGTEFICHLCGIHCPSKSSLTNHLHMKCGNVCEICKEIFPNLTERRHHMFNVHKKIEMRHEGKDPTELNFSCTQCPNRYASMHTLNHHIRKKHSNAEEQIKFQCVDCGNMFSSAAALRKHSSLHRPPELPCPVCGKLFHNRTYMLRHANSAHRDPEEKKFKCEICGKGFMTKISLEGHHNWHYNLKPFQCRWCERTYQNQSNCNAHERKGHTAEYQATMKNENYQRIQVKDTL